MTKKDFHLIARVFNDTKPLNDQDISYSLVISQWLDSVRYMATELATTNPRFDRNKFLQACGIED